MHRSFALTYTRDYIAHLDGFTEIDGGWLNQHWIQLAKQLADSVAGFAYSFGGTCLILFLMNLIPGLRLRASEEAEVLGMDDAEIGEFAVSILRGHSGKICRSDCDSTIMWSLPAMCSTAMPSMRPAPSIRAVADPRWSPRRKRFRPRMMTVEYNSDESFRNNSLLIPNLPPPPNVLVLNRYCILSFSEVSVRFRTWARRPGPPRSSKATRPTMNEINQSVQRRTPSIGHIAPSGQRPKCSVRRQELGI